MAHAHLRDLGSRSGGRWNPQDVRLLRRHPFLGLFVLANQVRKRKLATCYRHHELQLHPRQLSSAGFDWRGLAAPHDGQNRHVGTSHWIDDILHSTCTHSSFSILYTMIMNLQWNGYHSRSAPTMVSQILRSCLARPILPDALQLSCQPRKYLPLES